MHINGMSLFSSHKGYPRRIFAGFLFVVFVASLVSGMLLLDQFRSYRADIDILILSKSIQGAVETEAARDTLMLLGSTEIFFSDVNETADISSLELRETGKGSFRVSVMSDTPVDARDGAVRASQELFSLVGRYYDIRSDISVRSIGSPRVETVVSHPVGIVTSSILLGILFSLLLFSLIFSVVRLIFSFRKEESVSPADQVFFPKREESIRETEEVPYAFSPDAFIPKKVDAKFFSFEPSGAEREKDYAHFNRGPAPMNLPVAPDEMESLPEFLSLESISEHAATDEAESDESYMESSIDEEPMIADTPIESLPIDREPTEEEYKKRLNDLLAGKMPK
jgi:hypothetical protein